MRSFIIEQQTYLPLLHYRASRLLEVVEHLVGLFFYTP